MYLVKGKRVVIIKTVFVGFHQWPDAPNVVLFLKNEHRHKFYVTAEFEIHSDRELEYFMLLEKLNSIINSLYGTTFKLGSKSCEVLCDELAFEIQSFCTDLVSISVFEDEENGSKLYLERI